MNSFIPEGSDREPSLARVTTPLLHELIRAVDATPSRRIEDRQYGEMQRAYGRSGGLAAGDDVARRLRRRVDQPLSTVARWIVERRIVSFDWQSQILVPLFQFDLNDMSLRSEVAGVVNELNHVFDSWELAVWFAQPNAWIDGACPVDTIFHEPIEVLQAARADRFIALG